MNKILLFTIIFFLGYITNDILKGTNIDSVGKAYAEVAGMDYYDLRHDWDFKKAVRYIVEDCDITGYIDGEYPYLDISC